MLRTMLLVVLLSSFAGTALAVTSGNVAPAKSTGPGDGATAPRTGGDTIALASPIAGLPYSDSGATCGYANDYDEICPYSGSVAPDVVYSFQPSSNLSVAIDLCASMYDTKLYVYEGGPGNLVACNDDAGCGYSGWQSRLEGIALTAGVTYYILVDGYATSCGTYTIDISEYQPCIVPCPPNAQIEGEPDCYDGYYDSFNGGCNGAGWTSLTTQGGDCGDLCGKSGTYLYNGLSYRDTDWFSATGMGETVTFECTAEFPVQMILIYGTDCLNPQYTYTTAGICTQGTLTWFVASGAQIWLWVGPSVFTGVPCGSEYVTHVCGIYGCCPIPAEVTSWGKIKNRHR